MTLVLLTLGTQRACAPRGPVRAGDSMLWGLARSARLSAPLVHLVCVDVPHAGGTAFAHALGALRAVPPDGVGPETELVCASGRARVGRWAALRAACCVLRAACCVMPTFPHAHMPICPHALSPNHTPLARNRLARATLRDGPVRLALHARGSLSHLYVEPQPDFTAPLRPDEVELRVRAVGLNFRDVLNVLGEYPGDPGPPGGDAAGVLTAGSLAGDSTATRRIFGHVEAPLASFARADSRLVAPMPSPFTFEQACHAALRLMPCNGRLTATQPPPNGRPDRRPNRRPTAAPTAVLHPGLGRLARSRPPGRRSTSFSAPLACALGRGCCCTRRRVAWA